MRGRSVSRNPSSVRKVAEKVVTEPAQPKPGDTEEEFGVPIPGVILPEELWARTALKKLPPPGPLNFEEMFGRAAPMVLDLGCGNGRFTLSSALLRPEYNHLASDILPVVIRYATRRANQRGLSHTRWAVIGGRDLLRDYIAPHSIHEIHCYHPQPFYERKEYWKRLVTPEFLALVQRSLIPDGLFVVQTDNPAYWQYMSVILPKFFVVHEHPGRWPDAPQGRTRREIVALQAGLPVFRAECRPRPLDEEARQKLVRKLPKPEFNADRRLMALDRLERDG